MRKHNSSSIIDALEKYSIPEPMSGCTIWLACTLPNGYGKMKINGKDNLAHRVSFECHVGPIPSGMKVLHRCDNRPCINPGHLFLGTHRDNMDDRDAKGRQARGAHHGSTKLTAEQVANIRAENGTQREIAARYGICQAHVSYIKRGETWRQLGGPLANSGDVEAGETIVRGWK